MNFNSRDERAFLNHLTAIVEANLNNEQFGINQLAAKTGLSRSQIHRRLKKSTNKSLSQFIREIRLEKAKELLKSGNLTVSEIAYKVGFGSPSYFIKSFHDYFGYPPGEYLKYAPKNSVKEEKASWSVENKKVKEEKKSFLRNAFTHKRTAIVLLIIVIVFAGLYVINKFKNREIALAVLPPDNLTGQVDKEYYAYGVQADLIGKLSEFKELRVISQKSTLAYRDTMMSLKDMARKLNINLIIAAGLIEVGDSLEIVLNLVDVFPNERNIWTNNYKTDIKNIMQIYTLASQDIAQKLHLNLSDNLKRRLNQPRKVNPESLKAYYRGMYYLGKDNNESFDTGIRYLREAIDNDPADPFAYAAIALGYAIKGHHNTRTAEEDFTKAGIYAEKALDLDSTIEEAYTARAMLSLYQKWDWDKAFEAFTEALRINPNNHVAHAHFAWYFFVHGNLKEAIYHAKEAVILDPEYISYKAWLATIYYRTGEVKQAENYAKIVVAEKDSNVYANIVLGWINLLRENYTEAIRYTEKLPTKQLYWDIYRAYVYNGAGDKEKALSFRNKMEERAKTRNVPDWYRGLMAAIFSYKDEAFKHFNTAIDKKQYQMMYIDWYPFIESLRDDPRYNELLARMNLPPNNANQIAANR